MNSGAMNAPRRRPKRRAGGVIVPHQARWYQRVAARFIYFVLQGVNLTLRYRLDDRTRHFDPPPAGQAIYCIWHNRLALSMAVNYRSIRPRSGAQGLVAIVSASRDGGLLAAILECFNVQPVRGSSSRRGPQAMLELTTWAERGYDLAITPDGPRGPAYVVQDGIMSLAQITGLPIILCSWYVSWKVRLKSWDQFQVPLPFARCEVIFEGPIRVPREATDQEREKIRVELEQKLRRISRDE
jgi:lysophospholipid acyltransferase (LPLAT)-like uncharacterized protein